MKLDHDSHASSNRGATTRRSSALKLQSGNARAAKIKQAKHAHNVRVIVTCEHGGNRIPPRYRSLFKGGEHVVRTHRGFDAGALELARKLASHFDAELVFSTTSRLLIELNRSPGHPAAFSEFTRVLDATEREKIIEEHYRPYRQRVEALVAKAVSRNARVLHISSHSFTPKLDGEVRRADIGLLYDPSRKYEGALCVAWQKELRRANASLIVRRNYPYRGNADGLTTYLRTRFPDEAYVGIEIEVNQKHTTGDARRWRALRELIVQALDGAMQTLTARPALRVR